MTALADIAKAHPALHGDALRGSDLAAFNVQHKRDRQGRFAAVAAAPAQADPRIARKARRLRRAHRAQRAGMVRAQVATMAAVEAEKAKEEAKQSDPRALQALSRKRILPRKQVQVQAKPQAAPKKAKDKAKIGLNDPAYIDESESSVALKDASFAVVDREQALQFHLDKSMIVGAANAKWDTELEAFNLNQLSRHVQENDMEGKVVLQISPRALVTELSMGPGAKVLAKSQYLALSQSDDDTDLEKYPSFAAQMQELPSYMRSQPVSRLQALPIIRVDAWSPFEALYMLPADKYPNIDQPVKKADETWDEDEHKRDPRSGRFTSLAQAQAAPAVSEIDPRIARAQRRKRRAHRARAAGARPLAEVATAEERRPEAHKRILERKAQERITARRTQGRPLAKPEAKPLAKPKPEAEKPRPRGPGFAPNFDPTFAQEGEAIRGRYADERYFPAKRDPRVRLRPENFEDALVGWDLADPDFQPGMKISQIPAPLKPAFKRWERAQARKPSS
jgi:hypothetical protein